MTMNEILDMYNSNLDNEEKVLIDVKGIFNRKTVENHGLNYWSL